MNRKALSEMKRQYITPSLVTVRLQAANMMATSLPIKDETDDEARSKKFWGPSMFDEEETEENESWY